MGVLLSGESSLPAGSAAAICRADGDVLDIKMQEGTWDILLAQGGASD